MNALLPVVLLTSVFMFPQPILVADVAVLDVAKDSPAEIGGVLPGDLVRMANGRHIDNSADLRTAVQLRLGTDITWIVERGGRLREVVIPEARIDPPPGQGATGIMLTDARLTVNTVEPGSTADLVGVKSGDLLLRIGPARVLEVTDPVNVSIAMLQDNPEKAVTIDIRRDQKIITLRLTPELGHLSGLSLNAYPDAVRSQSLVSAFLSSLRGITDIFLTVRNEISRWIAGSSTIELAGPVGIAQITGDVARLGISPLITWTALLSLNLAIINLLPLPALDGGRITFVLLELARGGRRLAPDKERLVHLVGFMALIGAIIVISINDIRRLVADA
jgi:regulator of sigma E protease